MHPSSRRYRSLYACLHAAPPVAREQPPGAVIFEDVRIFDGSSDKLSGPSNGLVAGGLIKTISSAAIADPPGATVLRMRPHASWSS